MHPDASAVHVHVVVAGPLAARALMALHRTLGLSLADVRRRVDAGEPVLVEELFTLQHHTVATRIEEIVAAVGEAACTFHETVGGAAPGPDSEVDLATLRAVLARGDEDDEPPAVRPEPDPVRIGLLADAVRAALADFRQEHDERPYAVALAVSDPELPPYLILATEEGDAREGIERWDLAASPYAAWGHEEHFGHVRDAWPAAGADGLASVEEALRVLDVEGAFGAGQKREGVLLLVALIPPDPSDAGFVRRLNPSSALRREWLETCAEQCPLEAVGEVEESAVQAPNATIAEIWERAPGLLLADGTAVHGPDEIGERNATCDVAAWAPGWVLVGDDSGGRGLFMRSVSPGWNPALGRTAAEVVICGLGALDADLSAGEFLTDDLIGFLTTRQRPEGAGGP